MARTLATHLAIAPFLAFAVVSVSLAQSQTLRPADEGAAPPSAEITPNPLLGSGTTSDWRASKLIGTTMSNVLGETVGSVEDIVIDADGKVVAVMVSVGGFLGLGETTVAIGLRHLIITHADLEHLEVKTSLSRKAIEQAAALEPKDDSPLPEGQPK